MEQAGEWERGEVETERLEGRSQGQWVVVSEGAIGERERERMAAVQELLLYEGSREYGRVQGEVAARLGISVRSVQRLMKVWREEGMSGLVGRERSDRGRVRISREWEEFIIKTYREGNSGGRQMNRFQVFERVKVRAQGEGLEQYPSASTVYRILGPLQGQMGIEKRSIGWRGGRLVVKTREGLEIVVTHSNQVWQVDHSKVDVVWHIQQ